MGRIHVLSEHVANKIAAGEVVERPASIVKELIENSLDAGASRIRVNVEAGGKKLIEIVDNGSGMVADDALLAFERHATSKLKNPEDLLSIATLGFRGEALPSIAAVSRLRLETCSAGEAGGTVVEIAGGRILKVEARGTPHPPPAPPPRCRWPRPPWTAAPPHRRTCHSDAPRSSAPAPGCRS